MPWQSIAAAWLFGKATRFIPVAIKCSKMVKPIRPLGGHKAIALQQTQVLGLCGASQKCVMAAALVHLAQALLVRAPAPLVQVRQAHHLDLRPAARAQAVRRALQALRAVRLRRANVVTLLMLQARNMLLANWWTMLVTRLPVKLAVGAHRVRRGPMLLKQARIGKTHGPKVKCVPVAPALLAQALQAAVQVRLAQALQAAVQVRLAQALQVAAQVRLAQALQVAPAHQAAPRNQRASYQSAH